MLKSEGGHVNMTGLCINKLYSFKLELWCGICSLYKALNVCFMRFWVILTCYFIKNLILLYF